MVTVGFRPLVTAWEMTDCRFSFTSAISRSCSAIRASILAVSRSRKATTSACSGSGGSATGKDDHASILSALVPWPASSNRRKDSSAVPRRYHARNPGTILGPATSPFRSWLIAMGARVRHTGKVRAKIMPRTTISTVPRSSKVAAPCSMAKSVMWSSVSDRTSTFMSLADAHGISPSQ